MCTYNGSRFVAEQIESICRQTYTQLQIIIVDDGSTDNTAQLIFELNDDLIKYFKIKNSERGFARNYGLKQAKGTYVNFFDSDDIFLPCLNDLHSFILSNNQPSVIYGEIQQTDENGVVKKQLTVPYQSFTKNLLYNNFLACGAVFLKHEVALQIPFNEDRKLSSAEDWELWLKIHAKEDFTHFQQPVFQQVNHSERSLATLEALAAGISNGNDFYFA